MIALNRAMRSATHQQTFRKRESNVNVGLQRDLRRLRKMNVYHREFMGQPNPNSWLSGKKMKAMGQYIEAARNIHPRSTPIDPKVKKELQKTFSEDSHWQYFLYRNELKQILEQRETEQSCNIEQHLQQLPFQLRKQIGDELLEELPQAIQPQFRYTEQYQIYLPMDERHRKNFALRMINPPKSRGIDDVYEES